MTPDRALAPLEALSAFPQLNWAEKLAYLTYELSRAPQILCELEHHFGDGYYLREMRIPAGTLFIGRPHLVGHPVILARGRVLHIEAHARHEREAPFALHTRPGDQMVIYAHTDVLGRTLHPNPQGSRDIEGLEAAAFEPLQMLLARGRAVRCLIERERYLAMLRAVGLERHEQRLHELCASSVDQIEFHESVGLRVGESDIEGLGLIATRSFAAGELIAPARIGGKRTPAGRYANHQDVPNAKMLERAGDIVLVALRAIAPEEEITVNYRDSLALSLEMRLKELA